MTSTLQKRDTRRLIIVAFILIALSLLNLMLGSSYISLTEVFHYFLNPGDSSEQFTIEVLRLPRVTLAILAGIALGLSGLLLQNVMKNPIASPDIIGVTGGATVGAVFFLAFLNSISIHFLPIFSVIGATITMLVLIRFQKRGNIQPTTLVIIGITLQTLLMALVNAMIALTKQLAATKAYTWIVGSLYGVTLQDSFILLMLILCTLPFLAMVLPQMKILVLHDHLATGLGLHIQRVRLLQIILATLLVAGAVSFVGNIGFVGLIAPHIAKTLIKGAYVKKAVMAAMIGAISILFADLIGRTIFIPKEVPAGVFTALFGAPFFIYLLLTVKKM